MLLWNCLEWKNLYPQNIILDTPHAFAPYTDIIWSDSAEIFRLAKILPIVTNWHTYRPDFRNIGKGGQMSCLSMWNGNFAWKLFYTPRIIQTTSTILTSIISLCRTSNTAKCLQKFRAGVWSRSESPGVRVLSRGFGAVYLTFAQFNLRLKFCLYTLLYTIVHLSVEEFRISLKSSLSTQSVYHKLRPEVRVPQKYGLRIPASE